MAKPKKTVKEKFDAYHGKHPRTFELFVKYTFDAIGAGLKKYGAWSIFGRIRWFHHIEQMDTRFKVSNNFIAHYTRLFQETYPQHRDFYTTRPLKTERVAGGV